MFISVGSFSEAVLQVLTGAACAVEMKRNIRINYAHGRDVAKIEEK
jgi:hypothetical protein